MSDCSDCFGRNGRHFAGCSRMAVKIRTVRLPEYAEALAAARERIAKLEDLLRSCRPAVEVLTQLDSEEAPGAAFLLADIDALLKPEGT